MGAGNIRISLFLLLFVLCGCGIVPMPPENKPDAFVQPPHNEIAISTENPGISIAFTKLVSAIEPGKVLGKRTYQFSGTAAGDVQWSALQQRIYLNSFPSVFNEKLKSLHYNVIGASSNLFDYKVSPPDLMVGAIITDATHNISLKNDVLGRESKHESCSLTVEWQVYDTQQQQVVYKKTTTGHIDVDAYGNKPIDVEVVSHAFSDALSGILEDEMFVAIVTGKSKGETSSTQKGSSKNNSTILDGAYITRYKHGSKAMPLSEVRKSVVTVQVGATHGSGFVVSENGLILTNYHVVSNADTVRVITYDGKTFDAEVIKTNSGRDVAVLHAQTIHVQPLAVNTKRLDIGANVFAIGSPRDIKLSGTVTNGIISSYRDMKNIEWIQSTAVINPGNSGGPLVDNMGSVVGISTRTMQGTNGIYFYIPIEGALSVLGLH